MIHGLYLMTDGCAADDDGSQKYRSAVVLVCVLVVVICVVPDLTVVLRIVASCLVSCLRALCPHVACSCVALLLCPRVFSMGDEDGHHEDFGGCY